MYRSNENLTQSLHHNIDVQSSLIEKKYEEDVNYAFDLGNLSLLVPESIVSELIEAPEYAFVPKMPKNFAGLCNVRGNLVPVFNLYKYLNISKKSNNQFLLTLGTEDQIIGIILESLPYVIKKSEYSYLNRVPDLPIKLEKFISGAYKKQGKILIKYNHREFFNSLCH